MNWEGQQAKQRQWGGKALWGSGDVLIEHIFGDLKI